MCYDYLMKTTLNPNEKILKTSAANLQRGPETVGGRLFLTNKRLIFEAHALNLQAQPEETPFDDISDISFGWTHFLGKYPVFPNMMSIHTHSAQYDFTIWHRQKWAKAIFAAKKA